MLAYLHLFCLFYGLNKIPLPAPLVGLIVGGIVAYLINSNINGADIKTIASNLTWHANGTSDNGIPPIPHSLVMPWALPGPDGQPLDITFRLIQTLISLRYCNIRSY